MRNGVECISGILVFQDIVQNPEKQCEKEFVGILSHIHRGEIISASVVEVIAKPRTPNSRRGVGQLVMHVLDRFCLALSW